MLKAVGILSTSANVKGLVVDPGGVEVPDHVPVLDSHNVANGCLGHLARTWVAGDSLWGDLVFTGRAGRWCYERVERQELTGCSCRFKIGNVTVRDADGSVLDIEEALARQDDPGLFFVAESSTLQEVSVTAMPSDPGATIRACSETAAAWAVIRDGEARLRRLLDRDRNDGGLRRVVVPNRETILHGAPERMAVDMSRVRTSVSYASGA
jgi:hypothetical protein